MMLYMTEELSTISFGATFSSSSFASIDFFLFFFPAFRMIDAHAQLRES